jgi:hypothetical protein
LQFTYNFDPQNVPADAVRWHVGDTDSRRPLVDDREISYALTKGGDIVEQASIIILKQLANKFAREADISVGEVSKSLGDISDKFRSRAEDMESDLSTRSLPFFGGRSISGKITLDQDGDAVPPHFRIGQGDDPSVSQLDYAYNELSRIGYWP